MKTRARIMVPGWRYKWGDRLQADDLAGMKGVSAKQAKNLAGMVAFRNPGGAAGGGASAGSHSQYLSFRMMTENSKGGWIAPARPGMFPARATADLIRPIAEEAFQAAVGADVKAILDGGGG